MSQTHRNSPSISPSPQPPLLSLKQNHDLHGMLIGVTTAAILHYGAGFSAATSLGAGGMTGAFAKAIMKTTGHPDSMDQLLSLCG